MTRSGTRSGPARSRRPRTHGIDLKYSNDPDAAKQATLIQNAIDSKVDGIATTLSNAAP